MRYFWYISKTKLDHLLSQQETVFDRLRASLSALIRAEIKMPIGSIGLEIKASEVDAKEVRILEKVEKKLRDADLVKSIEDFSSGSQPLFFQFHGPTARLIQDGQFWVATLDGDTAILLGGSAAHCIGCLNPLSNAISPSANPLGSMEYLLSHRSAGEESTVVHNLSYIWASVIRDTTERLEDVSALPHARGIAIYAASTKSNPAQLRESGYEGQIHRIIVGSPIFVEQAD
jgi:hypothetical protein